MHMRHGKQQRQQKYPLSQILAMIHAGDFATGKPGAHIGGIGDMKPILFTREIFQILWCYYINMNSLQAQPSSNCVNQGMTLVV